MHLELIYRLQFALGIWNPHFTWCACIYCIWLISPDTLAIIYFSLPDSPGIMTFSSVYLMHVQSWNGKIDVYLLSRGLFRTLPLRVKCQNTDFFLVHIFLYLEWIPEKWTRKSSLFGHFSGSVSSIYNGGFFKNSLQQKYRELEWEPFCVLYGI